MTGGEGFIGAHVVSRLVGAGAQVVTPLHLEADSPPAAALPALTACDTLIHLAYLPPATRQLAPWFRDELCRNVLPAARLLEAAELCGISQVCLASSTSVYPALAGVSEDDAPDVDLSPFARAKLEQERLVLQWAHRSRGAAAILRLSTVYGPGEKPHRAIPRFIEAALGGRAPVVAGAGRGPFDPVHVLDVADAFVAAAQCRASGIFNIGTGRPRAPKAVASCIVRLTGRQLRVRHDWRIADRPQPICDVTRAARDLGFVASTSLARGLWTQIEAARRVAQ